MLIEIESYYVGLCFSDSKNPEIQLILNCLGKSDLTNTLIHIKEQFTKLKENILPLNVYYKKEITNNKIIEINIKNELKRNKIKKFYYDFSNKQNEYLNTEPVFKLFIDDNIKAKYILDNLAIILSN